MKSATAAAPEAELSHNLLGQRLGRKGRDTRARILAAAESLLARPEEPFTLSAVAREAGLRITSLYLYFADLSELLGAVLDPVMASAEEAYVAQLREHWPDESLGACCLRFVEDYFGFWRRHSRVLHLRNSFSDAGDRLMWRYRLQGASPLTDLLVAQMECDPRERSAPAHYTAQALLIAIERMATTTTDARMSDYAAEANLKRKSGVGSKAQAEGMIRAEALLFELAIAHNRAVAKAGS